ncbi:ribosome maturation factor RimM [Thiospirillum jenense]|uniref:ribosome maturation factor RimM n=1 Tax=Thiospirillum jenense TaxID=1653858 RepID=UPI0030B858A6
MNQSAPNRLITLGKIAGVFGIQGWVKVHSATAPRDNILRYSPWRLRRGDQDVGSYRVRSGQVHNKGLIAWLDGCDDRDQAAALVGLDIVIERQQLPPPSTDEFYWVDLEGLTVETAAGVTLGRVTHLLTTGANDVLVVHGDRERLLPFIWDQVILDVDFERGRVRVDWDPEF